MFPVTDKSHRVGESHQVILDEVKQTYQFIRLTTLKLMQSNKNIPEINGQKGPNSISCVPLSFDLCGLKCVDLRTVLVLKSS